MTVTMTRDKRAEQFPMDIINYATMNKADASAHAIELCFREEEKKPPPNAPEKQLRFLYIISFPKNTPSFFVKRYRQAIYHKWSTLQKKKQHGHLWPDIHRRLTPRIQSFDEIAALVLIPEHPFRRQPHRSSLFQSIMLSPRAHY